MGYIILKIKLPDAEETRGSFTLKTETKLIKNRKVSELQ